MSNQKINLKLNNLLINNEFFELDLEVNHSVVQKISTLLWHEIITKKLESKLNPANQNQGAEVLRDILHNFSEDDLLIPTQSILDSEALSLAEDRIVTELAKEGLPPPKMLKEHALMLVRSDPSIINEAKRRILARQQVARDTVPRTIAPKITELSI